MPVWDILLSSILRRVIRQGYLRLRHADGRVERFGGAGARPSVTVHLDDRALSRALVLRPSLALGEAYADGRLTVGGDDIRGLLELLLVNLSGPRAGRSRALWRMGRRLSQFNPPGRARRNVSQHYDLPPALYELFLDVDRQYSCAYFENPQWTLDEAQAAKKNVIARKLLLKPGHRVLDIGSGWGGLALHLAQSQGAHVTGVTLSREQHRTSSLRAASSRLGNKPNFRLEDYRHVTGTFDRVVSVGMFEHVGAPHYGEFFRTVRERLTDDGVALIHTIGRAHGPAPTDPWIARYIFPGAAIPALSEILPAVERSGLILTDVDVWRLHYAQTLNVWRERFQANRDRIEAVCGARFGRLWSYYLAASEMAFRHGGLVVYPTAARRRIDAVPLTRDYLLDRFSAHEPAPVAEAG